MLEIVALVFAARHIGRLALQKGLKPLHWKLYVILTWIIFEFWGIIIGLMIFDKSNVPSIMLVGITAAFTGFVLVKKRLERFPDQESTEGTY